MEKAVRMQTQTQSQNMISLWNGCQIKGTYAMSLGGLHVNLYIVNADGLVIGYRNYAFSGRGDDAQDKMRALMGALEQLCIHSKFDEVMMPRIQEAAAKSLFRVMTKAAVFKVAA